MVKFKALYYELPEHLGGLLKNDFMNGINGLENLWKEYFTLREIILKNKSYFSQVPKFYHFDLSSINYFKRNKLGNFSTI